MEVLAYSFVSGSRLVTALRQKQPDAFPFQTRRTRAGTVYALVTDCGLNGKTTGPQSKKLRRVALDPMRKDKESSAVSSRLGLVAVIGIRDHDWIRNSGLLRRISPSPSSALDMLFRSTGRR
ncbi:predicted protein [Histoplasma capsulatum G186AR]|uniref:Uncharacterized protein n=1 Tax=Ajellomyces capsulatus (strain G186AR / H82 / ATCC MYA-2454 / RMSCC 2432) TaxID=447093 RepID=C0NRA0_AJECG|nr:uncharacterized protein HCBG_05530 [Histoplasma capsulatum G186AR]EEH06214.1 predicted protein [Histoplasma capsulatum G186AR]